MTRMTCRLLVLLVLGCWISTSVTVSKGQDTIRQRWAVLIGVNDYAELKDLQFCKNDATALAEQLVRAGFPRDNVYLLCDGAGDAKDLPTKSNIERRIKNVLTVADKGDLVLVSFSGHGVHLNGKTYLCPTGARVDEPAGTMVPLLDVYGNLDRSRATRKLLWVDACRNDPRPSGMRSAASHEKSVSGVMDTLRASPEGILTLASCAAGQISWEDEKFEHGVFMQHLLEGLSGKADTEEAGNRNGRVSMLELYAYANINTKRFVLREKDRVQTPELFGKITGDFDMIEIPSEALRPQVTNSIGMKLKLIPAGEFLMGSAKSSQDVVRLFDLDEEDAEHFTREHPQHRVRITKPFYLGLHEVTVGQFREFVEAEGYRTEPERDGKGGYGWNESEGELEGSDPKYTWRNAGFTQTDAHPVVNVTWNDALAFCKWLSEKEGVTYRLPTEAEWEYACRAGTATVYYHGDDPEGLALVGNVLDASAKSKLTNDSDWEYIKADDAHVFTAPVGCFRSNAYGLYDMHGNVWEWCADRYDSDYYEESPTDDPTGPTAGSRRVLRGSSWRGCARFCRSAFRYDLSPDGRNYGIGFRLALHVKTKPSVHPKPSVDRRVELAVGDVHRKKGRSLDVYGERTEGESAGPARAYFGFREKAVFQIQIPRAMQLFKGAHGRAPKSHEEFMSEVTEANSIQLPELPPGHKYLYDPNKEELMVVGSQENGRLMVTIDDRRFLVEGQEKTADEIAQLAAKVPDEFSVKVIVICKGTSRAAAEKELTDKLDSQGISHQVKDE